MSILDDLERLEREATPGKWEHHGTRVSGNTAGLEHVATCHGLRDVHDAKLIASARNALPALLAVARAAVAWEEADVLGDAATFSKAETALLAAVRAFKEGK